MTLPLASALVPFYFLGGCFAAWAVIVAFLGITRDSFPATKGAERIVATISIVLFIAAVSAAIIGAINEEEGEEDHPEGGERTSLVLPVLP